MPLRLSRRLRARLARASDILLSPLDYPTPAAWREVARAAVGDVVRADFVAFRLPPALSPPAPADEVPPAVEAAYRRAIRARPSALVLRTTAPDTLLMAATLGHGSRELAGVICGRRPERPPFRDSAVALLRLLYPAFRAGMATCGELARRQAGLCAALDGLTEGAALVDGQGRTLYHNRALDRLLAADPEARTILVAADALAGTLLRGSGRAGGTADAPARTSGEVRTAQGCYRLFGTILEPGSRGPGSTLLLVVEPRTQRLPDPSILRRRYGLSRREAEVALLLARGGRNDYVAACLGISPHTARHHTEMVLSKLGIRSRAEVAGVLVRA